MNQKCKEIDYFLNKIIHGDCKEHIANESKPDNI